jgi:acyl-homoserine-lactone acylase
MHMRRSARAALFTGCLAALLPLAAAAQTSPGTINWDQYGVPHIYGPDVVTVTRGLGYAQMENHAETLLTNIAKARGRLAEYFGPGAGNANISSDIQIRNYGIPARAAAWVAQGGAEEQGILQAFCAGISEYAQRHGDTIDPVLKRILPVVPADIAMGEQATIWFSFIEGMDGTGQLIDAWNNGGLAAANQVVIQHTPTGSNGWAIAPSHTTTGNAILVANPHLPWGVNQPAPGLGQYQWIEVNLVVGMPATPTLNASGVTFIGGPFIGIGYSDYLGWTHTNNPIKNADLFQLTLDNTGTKYLFGGTYLPLLHTLDSIKVLQPNGTTSAQIIDIYSSIHGPVMSRSADGKTALVLHVPGLGSSTHLATQYWNMIQARTLNDFITANAMLQMPFFNLMYADRAGNIMYVFDGQQPIRKAGLTWSQIAGIQDGTDPTLLATKFFAWHQLPQSINPAAGFIANSNNPPWNTVLPQPASLDPVNYPAYITPDFMELRPQHGALFAASQPKFSPAQILAGKMSTRMELAARVTPDLITAAIASNDPLAKQAAGVLAQWDYTADSASVGAALFEAWWNLVIADVSAGKLPADTSDNAYYTHPQFRIPWNHANPTTTPVGLANAAAMVPYLHSAAANLNNTFADRGGMSIPWGNAHHSVLVYRNGPTQQLAAIAADHPQSGADDPFGPIRVTAPFYVGAPYNEYMTSGGDGYVHEIEFTPQGARGGSLLTYGNASRPFSPHVTDQLSFFDSKSLRPALRTLADVQANTVSVEGY